ncbi:MAG: hypothetical protein INR71_05360 [Terriglobus roseus]|nr:hypothetical protein [Terriglobus roseus]
MPEAVNDATADTAIFLMLSALRGFSISQIALKNGNWRGHPPPPLGHDPEGKTLGILGMGGIGRNMKRKADAFGMTCIYHNRSKLSDELSGGAEYVCFDDLLARSDVLSLNLPLNVSFCLISLQRTAYACSLQGPGADEWAAEHAPHHLGQGVCEDEEGHRDREYGARRRHGRGRAGAGARQRAGLVVRAGRLRGRAQDPSGTDREPARLFASPHGHLDR